MTHLNNALTLAAIFMRALLTIVFLLCGRITTAQPFILPISDTCKGFGIACGIAGITPVPMMQTAYLVNHLDKSRLLTWLISENPYNQIHGYIGLYFMKRNGLTLTQEEKDLMKIVDHRETVIEYCQGCTLGLKDKISNLLTQKRIKGYYRWYIKSGYQRL
jgi:hypothetical protein